MTEYKLSISYAWLGNRSGNTLKVSKVRSRESLSVGDKDLPPLTRNGRYNLTPLKLHYNTEGEADI